MNKENVTRIISNIKNSSDRAYIHKQLLKVRAIVKNSDGVELFYRNNGLKPLLNLLQKPNEQILDIVLSILGNCCTKKQICIQTIETEGILSTLISIITSSTNTGIQCRACRLLGNLAQHSPKLLSKNQESTAAYALNAVMKDSQNPALLIMTVRTIRLLWTAEHKFRSEVINDGIVGKIIQILIDKMLIQDKAELKSAETPTKSEPDNEAEDRVVIRRADVPDRIVTKEKFNKMKEEMESNSKDKYCIVPQRNKDETETRFAVPSSPESLELLTGILKCLQMITTVVTLQVAQQLYCFGLGYPAVMFLCSADCKFRSQSLKVVSNLASNPSARPILSGIDAVVKAVDLLVNTDIKLDESEIRYCVNIICLLTSDSCNRAKIRHSGGLKVLLNVFQNTKCNRVLGMILYGLYQFRFDDLSIDVLMEEGIIRILIERIADQVKLQPINHVTNPDNSKDDTVTKKTLRRKRGSSILLDGKYVQVKKPKYDGYYEPSSPGASSSSSGYSSSVYFNRNCSTSYRSYSPTSTVSARSCDNEDDFDSEEYSPVCSDNEENEDERNAISAIDVSADAAKKVEYPEFDILKYLQEEINNDDDETQDPEDTKISHDDDEEIESLFEKKPITPMLTLLAAASIRNKGAPELVLKGTLDTLLKICSIVPTPTGKAFHILENIVSHYKNFIPLVKQDFVFRLHDLSTPTYDHADCFSCREMVVVKNKLQQQLGKIGETGYGIGELAHFLLAGDEYMRKHSAIITTFIIMQPSILNHLLVNCNGLNIILDLIFSSEEDKERLILCYYACAGLTTMAVNLKIKYQDDKNDWIVEFNSSFYWKQIYLDLYSKCCISANAADIVTFHVKDSKKVQFDKKLLCEYSDVFKSMLTGEFLESRNNEVHLADIDEYALKYFFYLLLYLENHRELVDDWLVNRSIILKISPPFESIMKYALDAYELSIKYIVPKIEIILLCIVKQLISAKCVLTLFEWSVDHFNEKLLDASIYYFLNADITGHEKYKLFRAANKSQYSKQWRELITDTILFKIQVE